MISGDIHYKNKIKDCYAKKDEVVEDISSLFADSKKNSDKGKLSYDKTGKSKFTRVTFWLANGNYAQVACYDWSKKLNGKNTPDSLRIAVVTKDFDDFLQIAY